MKHEYEAPDFARRADHLTPEDMPMRMTHHDYSTGAWKHRPHPQKRGPEGGLVIVLAVAMIAALVFSAIYAVRFLG